MKKYTIKIMSLIVLVAILSLFIVTPVFGSVENLSTYTEVDASNVLSRTSTRVTGTNVDANIEAYLYKDYGVDYFNGVDIYFEVYVNSSSSDIGTMAMGFSDTIDDISGWESDSLQLWGRKYAGKYRAFLMRGYAIANDYGDYNLDQVYYWHIVRVAGNTTVNAYIYSDSAHTTLVDTLTVTGYTTAKWRYLYTASSQNYGTDGRDFNGYFQNFASTGTVLINTDKVYYILFTSAICQGNITNLVGGDNVTIRGFQWGTVTATYTTNVTESGSWGTGIYTLTLTSLPVGSTIYLRAEAYNGMWGYGSELTFFTGEVIQTDGQLINVPIIIR
jgi:hypothetical protein